MSTKYVTYGKGNLVVFLKKYLFERQRQSDYWLALPSAGSPPDACNGWVCIRWVARTQPSEPSPATTRGLVSSWSQGTELGSKLMQPDVGYGCLLSLFLLPSSSLPLFLPSLLSFFLDVSKLLSQMLPVCALGIGSSSFLGRNSESFQEKK